MSYSTCLRAAATVLAVLLSLPAPAQSLTFDRAIACASGDDNYPWGPQGIVVDAQGNTYVAGIFNGTIVLGSTILSATQPYTGLLSASDSFIAKLDPAGNYLWAVQLGDGQDAGISGLAVDAAGDVYVSGFFRSYSLILGSSGLTLYNSSANSEAFVAKLDGTTRRWLWARRAGGTGDDYGGVIAVNAANEVYLNGRSSGTAATYTTTFGPFTLTAASSFLAKLDGAGTWQWARPVGSGQVSVAGMLLDPQGDIYLSGTFGMPSATFGATVLTTQPGPSSPQQQQTSSYDLFVARMSETGVWHWAVQGDANSHRNIATGGSLATDGQGHLYLGGSYAGTAATIGTTLLPNLSDPYPVPTPAPPVPSNNYYTDAYVARLSAATGAWEWAVRNGGPNNESTGVLHPNGQGGLYALGGFRNAASPGGMAQLAQLDGATGAWQSYSAFSPVVLRNFVIDGQNRLNLAGYFYSATAQFGATKLAQDGPGRSTGYIARLSAGPLAASVAAPAAGGLQVWPNPAADGSVQVQGPPPGQPVQVLDVLGRVVGRGQLPASGPLRLDVAPLPAGVYVVRSGGQARRLVVEQ